MIDLCIPSPIIEIAVQEDHQIKVFIKRDDLIHKHVSGNKWRKLKGNLRYAKDAGYEGILTFGGAFSNHLYATAAACKAFGLKSIGIVRGEIDNNNPTLKFCRSQGMKLLSVQRSTYRQRSDALYLQALQTSYPTYWIVPEGGSNIQANEGLVELVNEVRQQGKFDVIYVAAGTGKTASVIINELVDTYVKVVDVVGGDFMQREIAAQVSSNTNWEVIRSKDRYGKAGKEVLHHCASAMKAFGLPLDPIYTGKVFSQLLTDLHYGVWPDTSKVLMIHTGGLQGVEGWKYRHPQKRI